MKKLNAFMEYCESTSKANGTTPAQEADTFWQEMDYGILEEEQKLMTRPLDFMSDVAKSLDDGDLLNYGLLDLFNNMGRVQPLHAEVSYSFGGYTSWLFVKTGKEGREKFYVIMRAESFGTMWEPPDGEEMMEEGVSVKLLKDMGVQPYVHKVEEYNTVHTYYMFNNHWWKQVGDNWAIKMVESSLGYLL